jgi:PHD/YefM family antitoxin component YafN of YafNO toxin-antitoxin module
MTAISNKETVDNEEVVEGEPRSLKQIIADVQATNEPILLTIGGEPQVVCLSVEAYRALEAKVDYWETVQAIREAEDNFERGDYRPAREAFEELGRKHGILR